MSDMYDIISKMSDEIDEDEVIKEIMLEYPDLFEMIDFNEYTIKERIEKNPYIYQQFRLLWLKERGKLHRIEILMDEYIGKLYDELRFHGDVKLGKIEVEKYYIPKDEKAIKFKKLMIRQQIRVDTYESIVKTFDKQSWSMKDFLKSLEI